MLLGGPSQTRIKLNTIWLVQIGQQARVAAEDAELLLALEAPCQALGDTALPV